MLLCQLLPTLIDRWCHKASLFSLSLSHSSLHRAHLPSLLSSFSLAHWLSLSHHSLEWASLSIVSSSFHTKHPTDDCLWSEDSAFSLFLSLNPNEMMQRDDRVKCCLYQSIEEEEILLLDLTRWWLFRDSATQLADAVFFFTSDSSGHGNTLASLLSLLRFLPSPPSVQLHRPQWKPEA